MTHILLAGATGKLGSEIQKQISEGLVEFDSISRSDLKNLESFKSLIKLKTVILDVTLPEGTQDLCELIMKLDQSVYKKISGFVIGSTGHSTKQLNCIEQVSKLIPVFKIPNFSVGLLLVNEILNARTLSGLTVAEFAKKLGFDFGIVDVHHQAKKDKPSGTALQIASNAGVPNDKIVSLRIGSVVGEHAVILSRLNEEIRIEHTSHSRSLFAQGAVQICERLTDLVFSPGVYGIGDVYSKG